MTKKGIETKKRGVENRRGLYAVAASHSKEAIKVLVELMYSRNENIRLGAAKALLGKALPDLRATELSGEIHEPIRVGIIKEYLSTEPSGN